MPASRLLQGVSVCALDQRTLHDDEAQAMGEDAQHPQADIEQPCRNGKPVWLSNETLSRSAVMSTPDAGFLLSIFSSVFFL